MSNNFGSRTEATRDDWQTPLALVEALGRFDLDPCANDNSPTRLAATGFVKADNGLSREWFGRVWCNPPYGNDARLWLAKCAEHGDAIALVPPRVGAKWFHDVVLDTADAMLFHYGRIAFIDPDTGEPVKGNNADSVLIAWGGSNMLALEVAGISGRLWRLR